MYACTYSQQSVPSNNVYSVLGAFTSMNYHKFMFTYLFIYLQSCVTGTCRFCVTDPPRRTLRSDSSEMLVLFRSFTHSLVCDDVQFPWKCHRYNIGFKAKFYASKFINQSINLFAKYLISVLARDSMLSALYAIARPSVRLSHGWISQKRLKLGSCNSHHTCMCAIGVSSYEAPAGPALGMFEVFSRTGPQN